MHMAPSTFPFHFFSVSFSWLTHTCTTHIAITDMTEDEEPMGRKVRAA